MQQTQTVFNDTNHQPTPLETKQIQKDARKDVAEELIKDRVTNEQKLDDLVRHSEKKLFECKGVFPFDLFPDTLTIEMNQVHVSSKAFFKSKRIHSVALRDISDVFVETSPFYATLKLIDRNFIENQISIPFLKKAEAIKAQRIIQGLVVAEREGVDVTKVHDAELVEKLEALGAPHTPNA